MDPPLVGASCGRAGCHNQDFLPTKCPACNLLYCFDHYLLEAHNCSNLSSTITSSNIKAPNLRTSATLCALEGCFLPCLESYVSQDARQDDRVPATCPRCSLSFCSQHRFPDAHSCQSTAASPLPIRNEAARAILARNFPSHDLGKKQDNSGSSTAYPRKQRKPHGSKLVQVMKMRQSAIPGDPKAGYAEIPDRLHIQARLERSEIYKVFWFRKSISTGRAFDLLQQQLQTSALKPWLLLKEFDESDKAPAVLTAFGRPLSEEFEDGCKVTLKPSE